MNKKILATAIGAAMVAPLAAHADIKVSGRVAADVVSLPSGGGSIGSGITFGDWGQGRLQFDGSSDSGLYARVAVDTRSLFFKTTSVTTTGQSGVVYGGAYFPGNYYSPYVGFTNYTYAGTGLAPRDIYFGYKGSWGSVQVGRMAGAVKNLEKDPFIATFLELRNNAYRGGALGSSSFMDNVVQYANTFGDTSIKLQYDPIDDSTLAGSLGGSGSYQPFGFIGAYTNFTDGNSLNGAMAASLTSKISGANVFIGYNNNGNFGGSYYKLGGNMTFSGIKVSLGYQNLDNGAGSTTSNFIVGGEMNLGGGQLVDVTYSDKGSDGTNAFYRIAYMKKMSGGDFHVGYVNNGGKNNSAGINPGNQGMFGAGVTVKF
jgi:hypothetical protein